MSLKYVLAACLCTLIVVGMVNFTPTIASSHLDFPNLDCYVSQNFLPNIRADIVTPTITPTPLPWEEEPNDIAAEATGPLDPNVSYYGYPNDLRDFFSFNVAISGRISITLQNLTGSGNRQLLLYYESTDNVVAYVTEEPFEIVRNNREPGRYLILIYVESDHNSTTPYTLRVNYPVALVAAEVGKSTVRQPLPPECTPTPAATSTPTSSQSATPTITVVSDPVPVEVEPECQLIPFRSTPGTLELNDAWTWSDGGRATNGYQIVPGLNREAVHVEAGPNTDLWFDRNSVPRLETPIQGDFDFRVHLDFDAYFQWQIAGVGIRPVDEPSARWIAIRRVSNGGTDQVMDVSVTNRCPTGICSDHVAEIDFSNTSMGMRIVRQRNEFSFQHKLGEADWTEVHRIDNFAMPNQVQAFLYVSSTSATEGIDATFANARACTIASVPVETATPTATPTLPMPSSTSTPTLTPTATPTSGPSGDLFISFENGVNDWHILDGTGDNSASDIISTDQHVTDGELAALLRFSYDPSVHYDARYQVILSPYADWSGYDTLAFDVWKMGQPLQVGIALSTGPSYVWHESTSVALEDGPSTLCFDLTSSLWNGGAASVPDLNDVRYFNILVYPSAAGAGEIYVDNIRLFPPLTHSSMLGQQRHDANYSLNLDCTWPQRPTPAAVGYNFEENTQGWGTSEGAFKLAQLETSDAIVYSGQKSLKLTTELSAQKGQTESVYLHTEATAYFNNAIPEGKSQPGPYDLTGKQVSCYVHLPPELANAQVNIQVFVKDNHFRNQFGEPMWIAPNNVESWQRLALAVGDGNGQDDGFDATKTNTLGVRIHLTHGSTLEFSGSIYIDHCSIE